MKFGDYITDGQEFGNGGYGHIYLAKKEKEETEKRLYVIKYPQEDKIKKPDKKLFNNEIKILKKLSNLENNRYTPFLYDSLQFDLENKIKEDKDKEKPYYVIDYFSKGLLQDYCESGKLTEKLAKVIFKKLLVGLEFLHKNNILHLDIKTENIVLDKDFWPIFIDFGFSQEYKDENGNEKLIKCGYGTTQYACPEIFKGEYLNEKADIFSLGVVLFNLVTGNKYGFKEIKDEEYDFIRNRKYTQYWKKIGFENLPNDFKELYVKMVADNPEERPKIKEIFDSSWLKEISGISENDEGIKNELENIRNEIKSENEIFAEDKISKERLTTRAGNSSEDGIFKKRTLKPKNIPKDRLNINRFIIINGYLSDPINFMNYLEKKIETDLKGNNEASEETLKFEVNFDEDKSIEKGESIMDIELLKYENDEKKYLIEFVRKGGRYPDYCYYFSKIKEIIKEFFMLTK